MLDTVFDFGGAILMLLGLAIFFTTLRATTSGNRAYHANKRLTPQNPKFACSGTLKVSADVRERRTKSGMAVDLKSRELRRQEQLSAEAIDEVIGRQL